MVIDLKHLQVMLPNTKIIGFLIIQFYKDFIKYQTSWIALSYLLLALSQ